MTQPATPQPWQADLGRRLVQALELSRLAHAPLSDDGAAQRPLTTRWRLPARPVAQCLSQGGAGAALAEMLGMGTANSHAELLKRCLQHYRTQLAPNAAEDDVGAALAAYLGACRQALDQQPLTPERWQAVARWLEAWVVDELPWADAPLPERQDAFERFAVLAVALGEWTVQASRQGAAQQQSATWMARNSLNAQLGLDLDSVCAVMRSQEAPIAANPSAATALN